MNMSEQLNAIWQFDREEETEQHEGGAISSVHAFVYEDGSLIIALPSISLYVGMSDDDVYRIKTRWRGNDLHMFPPFGKKWELFATWDSNRFVMYGDGKMRIFKKITPEEIAGWQKDLLKAGRQMWNYPYVNPDDVDL
jgi:hypothetical protein